MLNVSYYNGKINLIEDMMIPLNDRAVYFGDGVYEVVYFRNGKIFALYDHLDRFYNSLRGISIDFNISRDGMQEILYSLLAKLDDVSEGIIYWQVSRGTSPRNHVFPNPAVEPNLLAYAKTKPAPNMKNKIKLITTDDIRFKMCNLKTINLLANLLASQKAEEMGCAEAVLHRNGIVTECSHSNISILKNGVLKTAPLTEYILPGTVRKQLIELCNANGIPVDQTAFNLTELMAADEIILMSTTAMLRSACEVNGEAVGGNAPELLEFLQDKYIERVKSET
jgi:Branched-chain amino acid aminotransferase/4-amino-4-deoxychorismate lyase